MNEDIIRMAREAGLEKYHLPDSMMEYEFDRCLARFAALVRADEREACAKVCEEMHRLHFAGPWKKEAEAIRSRSQA